MNLFQAHHGLLPLLYIGHTLIAMLMICNSFLYHLVMECTWRLDVLQLNKRFHRYSDYWRKVLEREAMYQHEVSPVRTLYVPFDLDMNLVRWSMVSIRAERYCKKKKKLTLWYLLSVRYILWYEKMQEIRPDTVHVVCYSCTDMHIVIRIILHI